MDNDDQIIGHILSRREAITLLGAASAAMLAACAPTPSSTTQPTSAAQAASTVDTTTLPSCIVRPALTEGPYFVDEKLNRSDIRSDPSDGSTKEGVLLQLIFRVSQITSDACTPLAGALVDVWHCDALGMYSDVNDQGFNTVGQKFLRGYQMTDANGIAQFTTIYPGWYQGRAVHIHFKIRTDAASGQSHEFTSQLFFDEALTDIVHAQEPYASKGYRTVLNEGDGIFQQGGAQLIPALTQNGTGYTGTFDVGLQMS